MAPSARLSVCIALGAATQTAATNRPTQAQLNANDLLALNYALTLENLEANFYNTYQARFTAANFTAAGYSMNVYDNFNLIQAHENAHVIALGQAISNRGGTPVPMCTYSFDQVVTDVASYISVARTLENTGVSAYDGAINTISDKGLQQVAATIATVEARHAAYLNQLNTTAMTGVPFPMAFDTAVAPADIVTMISPLIASCPYTITAPQILVVPASGAMPAGSVTAIAAALFTSMVLAAAHATS